MAPSCTGKSAIPYHFEVAQNSILRFDVLQKSFKRETFGKVLNTPEALINVSQVVNVPATPRHIEENEECAGRFGLYKAVVDCAAGFRKWPDPPAVQDGPRESRSGG